MPILRNPFTRKQDVPTGLQPSPIDQDVSSRPSFERVSTVASRTSSMSIKTTKSEEPVEYKMSGMRPLLGWNRSIRDWVNWLIRAIVVVNDSGVYLPVSMDLFIMCQYDWPIPKALSNRKEKLLASEQGEPICDLNRHSNGFQWWDWSFPDITRILRFIQKIICELYPAHLLLATSSDFKRISRLDHP